MSIFERINKKLYGLHENCKVLYQDISNMEKDGNVVKTTYQKWITQVDKLKQIELCARVDPNAPKNAIPTAKLV